MEDIIVYGIPNCDTTKKALTFLKKKGMSFTFHDYKQQGITKQKLEEWCKKLDWETIFNKRSTTWRQLPGAEQKKATSQSAAIKLMVENNSIIKRPIIEAGTNLLAGFNENEIKRAIQ
jgi:Spx/MgsR family transcriptional regulator